MLSALDKIEERKKLELEIEPSEDEIPISKKRKLVAKLDEKEDELLEALWSQRQKVLLSVESLRQ